ncbi:MAG: GNAT family N-acetyltransferase [Chloroflexi bacterium]|nr:GNAT family N-acetyltransferase [Chloroflexota bacterium]
MVTIRNFQVADVAALTQVHNVLYPTMAYTAVSFNQHLRWIQQINGRCWVIYDTAQLVGYGCIYPIPGIHGLFEMSGGILPSRQRQEFGSQLLQQMIADLAGSEVRQLSYAVKGLDTVAAQFFSRHGFFVEHEEYHLQRANTPLPSLPEGICQLKTIARETAVSQFLTLYNRSFGGMRWYQPFTKTELIAILKPTDDLLFYYCEGEAIGFVWLRYPEPQIAEIEPIGIVKAVQGKGYGRSLLHHTLHYLQTKSIQQVNLGVWADNIPARNLYHQFDFQHHATTTYLAFDL